MSLMTAMLKRSASAAVAVGSSRGQSPRLFASRPLYNHEEITDLAEKFFTELRTADGSALFPPPSSWSKVMSSSQLCLLSQFLVYRDVLQSNSSTNSSTPAQTTLLLCQQNSSQGTGHSHSGGDNVSNLVYTIITPLILLLGVVGNVLCIRIFAQRRVDHQSSSVFFVAMSASDLLVLLLHVVPDWMERGLSIVIGSNRFKWFTVHGVCQAGLYFSYVSRFVSVWMLVVSTTERYFAVYHPFLRRRFFKHRAIKRIVVGLVVMSLALCLWKPLSSGVIAINNHSSICASRTEFRQVAFMGDVLYAGSISIVPSVIILVLNLMIAKRLLVLRRYRRQQVPQSASRSSRGGIPTMDEDAHSRLPQEEIPLSSGITPRSSPLPRSSSSKGPVLLRPSTTSYNSKVNNQQLRVPSRDSSDSNMVATKGVVRCNGLGYQVDIVGIQFATLLLLISTCYLVLSWPYYILWVLKFFEGYPVPVVPFSVKINSNTTLAMHQALNNLTAALGELMGDTITERLQTTWLSEGAHPSLYVSSTSTGNVQHNLNALRANNTSTTSGSVSGVNIHKLSVDSALPIARAVFYANFSINFFLYTFASKFFRKEMKRMFTVRSRRRRMRALYDTCDLALMGETQQKSGAEGGGDEQVAQQFPGASPVPVASGGAGIEGHS